MSDNLVHLHVHTEHSFLDGLSTVEQLVQRVVDLGQGAVAITDHGEVSGHLRLQREADKAGIKPLFGMEGYFTDNRFDKTGKKGENYDHMTLVALDQKGLENLWALSSLAYIDGSYYGNPRFDWELLEKYSEGLIATGGCMGGCIGKHLDSDLEKAIQRISRYQNIFGDNFFLELHTYKSEESDSWNKKIATVAEEFSIPLLAVSDAHYARPDDWFAHELMTAIQMGKNIEDPDRFSYGPNQLCIFSEEETRSRLDFLSESVVDQAVKNTLDIANRADARIPGARSMPVFFASPEMDERQLKKKVEEGYTKKIVPYIPEEQLQSYRDRLDYELKIICDQGFPGYFLTVQDIITWSKNEGYLIGPSRGSVGGSLLAYCMDITEVDPLKAGLLFERFLDPERASLPDIDIDFPRYERHLVRSHLEEQYGKYNIASIGTLNTLGVKQTLRDLCRGLNIDRGDTDKICNIVEDHWNVADQGVGHYGWDRVEAAYVEQFAPWKKKYPKLFEMMPEFLTHIRHASAHAAGVVISKDSLIGRLPLRFKNDDVRTQFDMWDVESLGFVKIDMLGLRTLSTLMEAFRLVQERHGKDALAHFYDWQYEWEKYYDDEKVWDDICSGYNIGSFQIETSNLRGLVKRFQPRSIEDLSAMIAVCRPGIIRTTDAETGLNLLELYLQKKEGKRPVGYKHANLKKVLGTTFGTFVYQEQIMQACVELAGYSLSETDRVRKIMGKMQFDKMKKERVIFIDGCLAQGVDEEIAKSVFDEMQAFGTYGFNKSHAHGYSMVTFWTSYMKTHYPHEFMAALFRTNPVMSVVYTREARRMGIPVLGPDINESGSSFTLTASNSIRYGISSVKFVAGGAKTLQDLGPYADMKDFVARIPSKKINKRAAVSLIKVGVFDSMCGDARTALREYWEARGDFKKMDEACKDACEFCHGSLSAWDCYADLQEEVTNRAKWEQELLGTLISIDPLGEYIDIISEEDNFPGESSMYTGEKAMVGGLITKVRPLVTKTGKNPGKEMCQFWVELPLHSSESDDESSDDEETGPKDESIQIVAFPECYARVKDYIEIGSPVLLEIEKLKSGLSLRNVFRLDLLKDKV
jgi:DNA polymerase-3 subunit alpha